MQISPAIEQPTRDLLGHAIRGEFDDFGRKLAAFENDEALQESLRFSADEVHGYLSRVVFGNDPLAGVFSADEPVKWCPR